MQSIQTYSTDHIILEGKLSVALPDDARIHAHIINSAKVRIGEFEVYRTKTGGFVLAHPPLPKGRYLTNVVFDCMGFDILPPPNLTVMVGESLRPITT